MLRQCLNAVSLALLLTAPASLGRAADDGRALTVVFGGDVMLYGGPAHGVMHGRDPFAAVADVLASADAAVCNLECVIATCGRRVQKPYTFRAPPECIPFLKRHFTAVSMANNHSGDYGPEALLQQCDLLEAAPLPYFGGGRNQQTAERPFVLERRGRRLALLGYNEYPPQEFRAQGKRPGVAWLVEDDALRGVRDARRKHRADLVIPFLHWGEEGEPGPTDAQRRLARRLIDAGADAVVGSHAHVTQTVDVYRGKPIVYSLGNFVFDYYDDDPPVHIGWLLCLTFARSGAVDFETIAVALDPAGIPQRIPATPAPSP